jgi:hypothetical protein
MPAYYVSWGRYPQLAGLVVLPTAAFLVARLFDCGRARAVLPLAAVAVAGQVLTHPRVALLLACLVLADLAVRAARRPCGLAAVARPVVVGVALVAMATALLLPWLTRLSLSPVAEAMVNPSPPTVLSFPMGLLTAGTDRYLLAAALAAVVVGLARRRRAAAVGALWVGLCLLAANPHLIGAPVTLILSNDALAIALFLPIAVLDGLLVVAVLRWLAVDRWPAAARAGLVAPLLAAGLWGAGNLAGVVNPTCLLATASDVDALRWVQTHTPREATFLVNSKRWQGDMHVGTDGGYWLPALAQRRASLPPLGYNHGSPADVDRVRRLAEDVESGLARDAARLRRRLLAEGITHVFVGTQGGPVHREMLLDAPGYRLAYDNGRAWVFEVVP